MDELIAPLVARAERYAEASGLALSTVSLKIFDDGKRVDALKGGVTCTIKRLRKASAKLDDLEREYRAKHPQLEAGA